LKNNGERPPNLIQGNLEEPCQNCKNVNPLVQELEYLILKELSFWEKKSQISLVFPWPNDPIINGTFCGKRTVFKRPNKNNFRMKKDKIFVQEL